MLDSMEENKAGSCVFLQSVYAYRKGFDEDTHRCLEHIERNGMVSTNE
jgi:hypothetical protein